MNRIRQILLTLVLVLSGVTISQAQEALDVKFGQRIVRGVPQGATNARDKKQDRNGQQAAIVRVTAANIERYVFDGEYLLKAETRVDTVRNEATLFFSPGHTRTIIRINLMGGEASPVQMDLGKLESLLIYDMHVKVDQDNRRTLIMPVLNIGGITNLGIMLAVTKKMGPYAKFTYNFRSVNSEGDCTNNGNLAGSDIWPYYGNSTAKTRLSVTAGALYRVWQGDLLSAGTPQSVYAYAGAGYGVANCYWKTNDDKWLRNADLSHRGIELEAGALVRYKMLAASLGIQSNCFKYAEATIGIGVMF
mgnify:CR=1 FL=1